MSIVIPSFNQARFLPDAIASAAARDASVEVIVVDDGSWDDTAAVSQRFANVTYLRQRHRGVAAARNRGLDAAQGRHVVFLDADDRLLPGGIDAGVRALAERPDCAMAYGRALAMDSDGTTWAAAVSPDVLSGHYGALLRTNLIRATAVAIFRRRCVLAVGGFREGFDGAADYDVYLRVARQWPVCYHGNVVAASRRHAGHIGVDSACMLRDTLCVMHANRPDGDLDLRDAWREGCRAWQDLYGPRLLDEMQRGLHAGAYRVAAHAAAALVRYAPGVLRRELASRVRAHRSLAHRQPAGG